MKTLYLMRHAKAAHAHAGQADHDRPLTHDGEAGAKAMGRFMHKHDLVPDVILASPAKRAGQTAALVAKALGLEIKKEAALYPGHREAILDQLATLPEKAERVLVVGHNPGIHDLAVYLAAGGDAKLRHALEAHMPPATLVELALDCDAWKHANTGGTLLRFVTTEDAE